MIKNFTHDEIFAFVDEIFEEVYAPIGPDETTVQMYANHKHIGKNRARNILNALVDDGKLTKTVRKIASGRPVTVYKIAR